MNSSVFIILISFTLTPDCKNHNCTCRKYTFGVMSFFLNENYNLMNLSTNINIIRQIGSWDNNKSDLYHLENHIIELCSSEYCKTKKSCIYVLVY